MNKLETEIKKLMEERKAALDRMHEEFDRADANNVHAQSSISKVITELTESVEQLERFLFLVTHKSLK